MGVASSLSFDSKWIASGLALATAALLAAGCAATPAPREPRVSARQPDPFDGLVAQEVGMPGVLYIRQDHGIGSYDAFLVPPASIQYERRSPRLPKAMEAEFLATLEQSLLDLSDDAAIPVVNEPGLCVMQIGLSLLDVDLDRPGGEHEPDTMTLVMEFRDSQSGQPLLRYATKNSMARGADDLTRSERIRKGFDQMLDTMDVGPALQAAGLVGQPIRKGCKGTLEARGRAAAEAANAR